MRMSVRSSLADFPSFSWKCRASVARDMLDSFARSGSVQGRAGSWIIAVSAGARRGWLASASSPVGAESVSAAQRMIKVNIAVDNALSMLGFSDAQILELRSGKARFDAKLEAFARLTKDIVVSRGHPDRGLLEAFFAEGWTKENLIDAIAAIGDKTVTNYLHGTTRVPVDFPAAPALSDRPD